MDINFTQPVAVSYGRMFDYLQVISEAGYLIKLGLPIPEAANVLVYSVGTIKKNQAQLQVRSIPYY